MPCFSLFQGLEKNIYGSLVETPFLSASRDYFQLLEVNYTYLHAKDTFFIHKHPGFQPTNKTKKTSNSGLMIAVDFSQEFRLLAQERQAASVATGRDSGLKSCWRQENVLELPPTQ